MCLFLLVSSVCVTLHISRVEFVTSFFFYSLCNLHTVVLQCLLSFL